MIYKAQWPIEGDPQVLIYEADLPAHKRTMTLLPATNDLKRSLFSAKYLKVFFEGSIDDGRVRIKRFVRQEQWV